jgi:hypothetical protein
MKLCKHLGIYLLAHPQEEKGKQYLLGIVPNSIGAASRWEGTDAVVARSGAPTMVRACTQTGSASSISMDVLDSAMMANVGGHGSENPRPHVNDSARCDGATSRPVVDIASRRRTPCSFRQRHGSSIPASEAKDDTMLGEGGGFEGAGIFFFYSVLDLLRKVLLPPKF